MSTEVSQTVIEAAVEVIKVTCHCSEADGEDLVKTRVAATKLLTGVFDLSFEVIQVVQQKRN